MVAKVTIRLELTVAYNCADVNKWGIFLYDFHILNEFE